jgi:hypothetical protein
MDGRASDGGEPPAARVPTPANRLCLDYRRAARDLPKLPLPSGRGIVDIHAHIGGIKAAELWMGEAKAFGVDRVYSMSRFEEARSIRDVLGGMVRFIAFPSFRTQDHAHAMTEGFLEDIRRFHGELGSRIVKFWNAPRLREIIPPEHHAQLVELDSPARVRAAELAQKLGMMFMVHIADPDTWFQTRYRDQAKFGKKVDAYRGLEVMLDRFRGPWIAAHHGGFPEDLAFLSGLLERHPNLYLDTSATKWAVRELSRHPLAEVRAFFTRWRGRLLFGSDIVTTEDHLAPAKGGPRGPMSDLADSPRAAAELYASRYYALRTLFETSYEGESPIADADLMMVDPARYDAMSAPTLRGMALPAEVLADLYRGGAERLLEPFGGV